MMLWGYNMTLSALLCSGNCSEVQFFLKSTNFGYTKDTSFFIWSISKQVFLTIFLIGTLSKKDLAAYHFSYQIQPCCTSKRDLLTIFSDLTTKPWLESLRLCSKCIMNLITPERSQAETFLCYFFRYFSSLCHNLWNNIMVDILACTLDTLSLVHIFSLFNMHALSS